ncbi:anthranilate synthase alpha subunit 1, chloroplastic [Dorcoceras hygrometricum]|uniref:Anthranilate synthase alpha subunit 1, chloroplastic n=1 Tax=Dorcoceras hygrometricum TaxID=472368 RepID=A0A2Z7APL9_9LAMI|nr:anthranilate synthase alpha subunit 1, chloroplastic [Dorcoceras hygrometricum]
MDRERLLTPPGWDSIHEDEMLEMKLLQDGKQCAEHRMLVDLGRNDVGKVSKTGSCESGAAHDC